MPVHLLTRRPALAIAVIGFTWKLHAHLVPVGVAVVPEPQPQELLIDVLRLLSSRMTRLVAVSNPVPAGVRRVYLRESADSNLIDAARKP